MSVNSNFSSGDTTEMAVKQRGIYFQAASGDINIFGSGPGALAATLVVPRPNPQPASTFTRTGISFNVSDQGTELKGPEAFPVKIAARSMASFTGGNFGTAGVRAALTLEAVVQGASIQGIAEPGARVRATGEFTGFTVLETSVTAAADGAFTLPVGSLPSGTVVQVTSGDPETRTAAVRTLTLGRTPFAIAGASDRQLLRGTVNLSLNTTSGDPGWSVSGQPSRTRARTLAVDTGSYPDGPLRVDVAEGFEIDDYLYLIVDNTAPSGGAGPDQQVRTGRDATLLTNARDANGVTSVVMAFGDGTSLTQRGAEAGTPLTHRYTKAGRFTASVTITDTAGNTTRDDAILTVAAGTASKLTGTLPKSVRRGKVLRITQRLSTPGTLRVQLLTSRGKVLSRGAGTALVAGSSATVTIGTRRLKRGTYILVRQLVSADGDAGPILTGTIAVKK